MKSRLPQRMRDYLREQGVCCKPATVANYQRTLGCFYEAIKTPIASLTKEDLQKYLVHLCERKLAAYTKVNYLLSVKKYLQWEVERGKLTEDILSVLDRSKLPQVPEYLPRPLSKENDLLLQDRLRLSHSPCAPFFLLLRHTGMRISELINLPPDCVLTGSNDEKYLKVPLGKMNTERIVPLSEESCRIIEDIKKSYDGMSPARLIGMEGKISRVYGKLSHHFKNLSENMMDQNKPVTFHRLRHTYATTLLTGGVSLVSLMKLLGHKRIEMTLRYAKVTPSHLRNEYLKAIRALERQPGVIPHINPSGMDHYHEPSDMMGRLVASLMKIYPHSPQQKNILRRLRRIQIDLPLFLRDR